MKPCWCRFVLAVLVIVLTWWAPSFTKIALTIIGALLAIMALASNKCCCQPSCETKEPEAKD